MRQSDIDRLEGGIRKIREESRDNSLVLLRSERTSGVDEGSSFFQCCESKCEKLVLELCFFLYVLE